MRHRHTTGEPTLSHFNVDVEVRADAAIAAREFIVLPDAGLPVGHPAAAFFRAWDGGIAEVRAGLAEARAEYAEGVGEAKTERATVTAARDFLLAVMRGKAADESQIAAAAALVRTLT